MFFRHYLYWLVFFVVQKPVFMVWQHKLMGDISFADYWRVMYHALPLDLSVASYVMIPLGLILSAGCWCRQRLMRTATYVLTVVVLMAGLLVMLGDNGTFAAWGYHWDKNIFVFMRSPAEMLACAPWWMWVAGVMAFFVLLALWWNIYDKYIWRDVREMMPNRKQQWLSTAVLVLMTGGLILPVRGSVTVSTMNTGRVYFSDNQMLNIAAINPLFNIAESMGENTFDVGKYTYMPTEDAKGTVDELMGRDSLPVDRQMVLRTRRPHIVMIILESFSQNGWEAMPRLQELSKTGVWFSHMYAGSYRTDRGVVEILSGFPGQPTSSLMTVPYKSDNLPNIGNILKQEGYDVHFYYGGDEDFTNMRSYLISGGYDERVSDRDFALSERISKWGVPDHILLPYAGREIAKRYEEDTLKHLDVILTLSSHEPFDVPMNRLANPYLNSISYTDSCIGAFIDGLRASEEWDSTLVVMAGDHGFPYPEGLQITNTERFRIVSLWSGGAIEQPQEVSRLCSQADIVPTLLGQMGLETKEFVFGKDALDNGVPQFAFFAYNDGYGLIRERDTVVIDAKANKTVRRGSSANDTGESLERTERMARAMVQRIMEEIEAL